MAFWGAICRKGGNSTAWSRPFPPGEIGPCDKAGMQRHGSAPGHLVGRVGKPIAKAPFPAPAAMSGQQSAPKPPTTRPSPRRGQGGADRVAHRRAGRGCNAPAVPHRATRRSIVARRADAPPGRRAGAAVRASKPPRRHVVVGAPAGVDGDHVEPELQEGRAHHRRETRSQPGDVGDRPGAVGPVRRAGRSADRLQGGGDGRSTRRVSSRRPDGHRASRSSGPGGGGQRHGTPPQPGVWVAARPSGASTPATASDSEAVAVTAGPSARRGRGGLPRPAA